MMDLKAHKPIAETSEIPCMVFLRSCIRNLSKKVNGHFIQALVAASQNQDAVLDCNNGVSS